jgi:hypothetical protein
MSLKRVLILAAFYLAIIGLALILVPLQFGIGAVPPNSPPELIALLRLLGGPLLGIAVLNWLARDFAPSPALRAIVLRTSLVSAR